MAHSYIYTLVIPEDAKTNTTADGRREVRSPGLIGGGTPSAQAAGLNPGSRRLAATLRGQRSDVMAEEVRELWDAPDYERVPYFSSGAVREGDGYYVLEDVTVEPIETRQAASAHTITGGMEKVGTRSSHLRRVDTVPAVIENDFGNTDLTEIGVASAATRVRWWEPQTGSLEVATPVRTEQGEFSDVDVFEVSNTTLSGVGDAAAPLVYDLVYAEEGRVDVGLWDTRNTTKTDANGNVQWQKVFTHEHEFEGEAVLDNGLLRVRVDATAGTISAEAWNETTTAWEAVALGTSDWVPDDLDVYRVEPADVSAQVEFRNTVDNSLYALNVSLKRGWTDALCVRAPGESGTTPAGLQTLLDPIASPSLNDPDETTALAEREEVRK